MKGNREAWWRRLWRRYPKIIGAIARVGAGLWRINWRLVIDSIFRYLQMVTVLTIVVTLIGIVDPDSANGVQTVLSIAAGFYLGIPVAQWLNSLWPAKIRNQSRGTMINSTVVLGMALSVVVMTLSTTDYLQALLSATVRVDEDAARRRYSEWYISDREKKCVIGGVHAHVGMKAITSRCFQHREQPITPSRSIRSRSED
jgi:hypothetical protein